ncbi:sodium/glutamate symporter [Sporosarcina sp. Marseille-Q4063]|uniref:sodium/glutamate symporter n=1 Tax=Sporosarcina sp. Marseille-Q4063 TaxID=2810514 RepID=UPI001BB00BED|nr:sodium/glutamate symporter [Sporosarcina sp. Marseille-Q4063]QUW21240.1 sodium/glutamate symporter [Sporosarcina sp. Marseille-Q4063]
MTIELNQVTTIFLSVALFVLGTLLVKRVGILQRFCIPAPVVGGLLFAIVAAILKQLNWVEVTLDTSLQGMFMLAFFTTVGIGASFKLVKLGGKLLIIYWLACGFLALAQNAIAISLAKVFDLHPLIGVMAGAISMEGGHGAATAFGQTIEDLGVASALPIGIAAATFGLIAGGLIGGPMAKHLISKYNLKSSEDAAEPTEIEELTKNEPINSNRFFTQLLLITFSMAVGSYLAELFSTSTGFVLPSYVGAMFVAVIVRNVVDKINPEIVEMRSVELIGDVTLGVFLSMALMSIKLWELTGLALPILVIVFVQALFIVLFGIFVLFRLLGKSFDAAVMVGGFAGHGLGATPNAMANMAAITGKFGHSRKAYLVVPIVGAFLVDVFAMPIIITTINIFS